MAAVTYGLHFSQNGERNLSRLAATQIQSNGRAYAGKLCAGIAVVAQVVQDQTHLAPAADHADVGGGERQEGSQCQLIRRVIFGNHYH